MKNFFKSLNLLLVIIFPQTLFAETSIIKHNGISFNAPIPKGFCNITDDFYGQHLLDFLKQSMKNANYAPTPKVIFANCNYLESEMYYPWGYIGVGKDTYPKNYSQDSLNKELAYLFGQEDFIEDMKSLVQKDVGSAVEEIFEREGMNMNYNAIQNLNVVWADENGFTINILNSGNIDGENHVELTHGTMSLLKQNIIYYYITDEFSSGNNYKSTALKLINNSEILQNIN